MKILNIYFKNINSLAGENRIYFDRAPIADCGVFAITGEKESGKSGILDAITLALYGETYRFGQPADRVITKSTTEGFAEIEFSLGSDTFRSCWHVKRKDGNASNELLPAEMKLLMLNDDKKILESSTQKVREKIAELTGMDFQKFCKSTILAQEDYAAFLNSSDRERMDILEKMCKTDISIDFKKGAEEKYNLAQTQLQHLQQDLNAIPIMDTGTIETKKHDLHDFQEQLISLENENNEFLKQLNWLQKVTTLADQEKALSNKLMQEKNKHKENLLSLERIKNIENTTLLEEEISVIDNKTEPFQQNKKQLDSYRGEIDLLQKQLNSNNLVKQVQLDEKTISQQKKDINESQHKLSELKSNLLNEESLLNTLNQQLEEKESVLLSTNNWLKEHESDKKLLDNFPDIEASTRLKTELHEIEEKQQAYTKWSKKTTAAISNHKSKITSRNAKIDELKKLVKAKEKSLQEFTEGRSLEELHDLRAEQQDRIRNFQELYDLATVNAKLGKKNFISQIISTFKSTASDELQLQQEADQLQLKIGKEQNIAKTLELAITNEKLLSKMDPDRHSLIDSKPCPLCGALEHPFTKHPPAVSNSQQAFSDQQKKIKELTATSITLKKQITSVQNENDKNEQKDKQLQNIRSQWANLSNKLNIAGMDIKIGNLSSIKELLKNEKQESSNITQLLKQYNKQQGAIKKTKSSVEANEVTLQRITQESELLKSEWDNQPQESIELEKSYALCLKQDKILSEKIDKQLEQLGEKKPTKKDEASFLERLENKKKEYQKNKVRQKALEDDIKALKLKIPSCSIKIKDINKEIVQYTEHVEQAEIVGLQLSLLEKQKLIAEIEPVFSKQESELTTLKQNLLDKYSNTGQKDLPMLREIIALTQRQPEIKQQEIDIRQNIDQTNNDLKQILSQLQTEKSTPLVHSSEAEILTQQKSIKEQIDIIKNEVNSLQLKLNKQDDLHEKFEAIQEKLAKQKTVVENCKVDKGQFADENSIQYRQKTQHTMADILLSHTNQILEKINGRYYLRKGKNEQGLALEIEDTKQQNERRLPKTLSEGESFIISLALALSMTEMANNGQTIDSFFLDEGFGNLDDESLYLVMPTLENLKTQGKTVGLISHKESVRKRIKTQIKMVKKPNGVSSLKVIS